MVFKCSAGTGGYRNEWALALGASKNMDAIPIKASQMFFSLLRGLKVNWEHKEECQPLEGCPEGSEVQLEPLSMRGRLVEVRVGFKANY